MAKDPAVLLYTQDFLVGTLSMTDEQRGKYIYLLCLQHQKGKLTLVDLKTKLTDEDIEVAERFPLQADGYYYNQRMYDEALKRKNYTESRRNNRKKKDTDIISETYVNRMENANANVNDNKDKLLQVYKAADTPVIEDTDIDYMIDETDIELTRPMLERVMDKFLAVDSRFKLQSVMSEINEDYGGFDNLIEMYLPNDTSAQMNWKKQLQQYKNGIYAN
jgi:hypothetical protein